MNESDPLVDFRGTAIRPGDTIVYPGRRGSALWLSEGVVLEPAIPGQRSLTVKRAKTGRTVEIFETGRCAVVTASI